MAHEHLTLKWGTIKGWDNFTEQSQSIVQRFYSDGVPMSAMADRPDDDRRKILCELIDQLDGEIWDDWNGVAMTKDEAKRYVLDYGKK
jgi:hypothetical protein